MRRALDFFVVEGIQTSIPLHKRILRDPDFVAGTPLDPLHGALPGRERAAKAQDGADGGTR